MLERYWRATEYECLTELLFGERQNGISLAGTLLAVSPVSPVMAPIGTAQAVAKELLNSILDAVVRIFGETCYCWRASRIKILTTK
ncbi:exocyst complex component SEC8-like [Camellia sinensis]|uniref:exocyst complex component SEC8-like n=1 Tax=Camellia sinensis TaxID=4442 RepID=UPI001036D527|nr:exocyst complex component SEC8-like [Camellia sinensis]